MQQAGGLQTYTVRLKTRISGDLHDDFSRLISELDFWLNSIAAKASRTDTLQSELDASQDKIRALQEENEELRKANEKLRVDPRLAVTQPRVAPDPPAAQLGEQGYPSRGAQMPRAQDVQFAKVNTITAHSGPVHCVQFDPTSGVCATASWDSTVILHRGIQSPEAQRVVLGGDRSPQMMGGLYAVAFAKTMPHILGCVSCDKSVYLWDHTKATPLKKLEGHTDEINCLDFHAQQTVMCTASDDCKALIWDFSEGMVLRTLDKHTKAVYGCKFLGVENQYLVATGCFDRKTRIFDMRDKSVVQALTGHVDDIIGVDYSSQSQILATGSDDGTVALWESRMWQKLHTINTRSIGAGLEKNEVKRVAFDPTGTMLAAGCSSCQVLVYDVGKPVAQLLAKLPGHTDCVFDVAWKAAEPLGYEYLVSASHDHTSMVWRRKIK